MDIKKIIIASVIILVGVAGIVVGMVLLRERQNLGEEASVVGGRATVTLSPESGNYDVGDTIPVSVYFDTDGIAVSGVAVRLVYPYSGSTPEISAGDIEINSSFLSSGDWSCPVRQVSENSGEVRIDISCANISASGYTTNSDTLLATFNLIVNRVPASNPTAMVFDRVESVITDMTGKDILLIPTSDATYSVGGVAVSSPTPISSSTVSPTRVTSVSPTRVPSITTKPSATPSGTITTTLTVTPKPTKAELPDAGVSAPTVLGLGLGFVTLVAAFVLAL